MKKSSSVILGSAKVESDNTPKLPFEPEQILTLAQIKKFLSGVETPFESFERLLAEQYLVEEEFQEIFGMSKITFNKLPKWKQDPLRKKALLY